ncbi:hypothetical protein [Blastococcus sp. CCUG 61487]|uniref:hypothetical protein n=1 Tax=Blastococcus sp. CCUG 61487 TaxID=1840703 RepID=UPI0010BF8F60|nr:hypothetical protein [Blastococcus sp. CCUG 61487]TKJ24372.1 hypothetical protein A6V29_05075 [Blastococcus sp. CCUG 61487]
MPDVYGPFDGTPWAQAQWYRHSPTWAPSGVLGAPAVSPTTGGLAFGSSGLNVSAGPGRAEVRGAGFERTGTPPLQPVVPNTNSSLWRRDRLVLRRDVIAKTVTTVVLQGAPSASPAAPALQQNEDGQWDEPLFSFLVPPDSGTAISGVVDERSWVSPSGAGHYTAWQPFTPTLTSSGGSQPLMNAANRIGRYRRIDALTIECEMHFRWVSLGLGEGLGSGDYRFGLPVPAAAWYPAEFTLGVATYVDAGTAVHAGVANLDFSGSRSNVQIVVGPRVGASLPTIPANGDLYTASLTYQAASP